MRRTAAKLLGTQVVCHAWAAASLLCVATLGGCTQDRQAGQVELFGIHEGDQTLYRFATPGETPPTLTGSRGPVAGPNDPVRMNKDVITLRIDSVHLETLPQTLTGSRDVVVFTEIWENASEQQAAPLTSLVYTARNQQIPGLMNFSGAIGYGATHFKGHPIRIKFTVMVLQKRESERQKSAVDVIENLGTSLAPQYGVMLSGGAKLIKDILAAQPDVVSFDYETTLCSDQPESLKPRLKTAKPEAAPLNGGPDKGKPETGASLYARRPWLRYGAYALVQTGTVASGSTEAVPVETVPNAGSVIYTGGRLRGLNADKTPGAAVRSNYLIFSILPEQLPQDDQLLEEASLRSLATLTELRRSDAEVSEAISRIAADFDFVLDAALRTKINQLADRAARQANAKFSKEPDRTKEKGEFESLFTKAYDRLVAGLSGADEGKAKTKAKAIYEAVLAEYRAAYDSASTGADGVAGGSQSRSGGTGGTTTAPVIMSPGTTGTGNTNP